MSSEPRWSLSDDKTTLILDLPTDPPARFIWDADELDNHIDMMATARMQMQPAIQMTDDPDRGTRLKISAQGRWYVEPIPDGSGFGLLLLHPGYRWVGIKMVWEAGRELIETIRRNLPKQ